MHFHVLEASIVYLQSSHTAFNAASLLLSTAAFVRSYGCFTTHADTLKSAAEIAAAGGAGGGTFPEHVAFTENHLCVRSHGSPLGDKTDASTLIVQLAFPKHNFPTIADTSAASHVRLCAKVGGLLQVPEGVPYAANPISVIFSDAVGP